MEEEDGRICLLLVLERLSLVEADGGMGDRVISKSSSNCVQSISWMIKVAELWITVVQHPKLLTQSQITSGLEGFSFSALPFGEPSI